MKKGGTIKKNFKFNDYKFYVTVYIDNPLGDDGGNLEEVKLIDVAYTAPPFKSASGGAPQPAKKAKPAATRKKTVKKQSAPGRDDNEEESKDVPIPEEIGPDEIKDPDVQRNLWSLLYCQKQSEKYEKIVNKALKEKKPVDDSVRTKMLLFQSQAVGIQSAIENEQVSFEQYMEYLNKGLAHDKVLLKYFDQTGNKEFANIVKFRIECFEQEINQSMDEDDEDE